MKIFRTNLRIYTDDNVQNPPFVDTCVTRSTTPVPGDTACWDRGGHTPSARGHGVELGTGGPSISIYNISPAILGYHCPCLHTCHHNLCSLLPMKTDAEHVNTTYYNVVLFASLNIEFKIKTKDKFFQLF